MQKFIRGFFQRFLITIPDEVFVKIDEKIVLSETKKDSNLELSLVFQTIFNHCQNGNQIQLSDDAFEEYKMVHDEIVNFRNADRFEEDKLSIKAKSLGHILRVSGIISLLREAVMKNNDVHGYSFQNLVVKEDFN